MRVYPFSLSLSLSLSLSAAFGYDFYIVPVQNALVTDFASAPTVDTATPVASTDTVAYSAGVFTIDSVAYTMDGTDDAVRLSGLTSASLRPTLALRTSIPTTTKPPASTRPWLPPRASASPWPVLADFGDAGYKILRLTEQNTVADGLRVAFKRVGPTGTTEEIVGYGTLDRLH